MTIEHVFLDGFLASLSPEAKDYLRGALGIRASTSGSKTLADAYKESHGSADVPPVSVWEAYLGTNRSAQEIEADWRVNQSPPFKIRAIKALREATGWSVKQSHATINRWIEEGKFQKSHG